MSIRFLTGLFSPLQVGVLLVVAASLGCGETAIPPGDKTIVAIQEQIASGDLQGARTRLKALLDRQPRVAALHNLLGIIDAQEDRYASAESNFGSAIRLAPASTGAYLNLGRLYSLNTERDEGAIAKGIDIYRRALAVDARSVESRYQLALLLEWRGSFSESLKLLRQLPADETRTSRVLALEAAALAGLNNVNDAAAVIHALVEKPDFSEEHASAILAVLDKRGNDELTLPLLEGLVHRNLAPAPVVRRLGEIYERLGQWDQARLLYANSARNQVPSVQPLLDLARVAYKQRDLEGALSYVGQARDLDPDNPKIHLFFGVVAMQLNVPIDAKSSLLKAIELEPENAYTHYAMGLVALQGHDPSEAVPYFQKYALKNPKDPRGRFAVGAAYFYAGEYDEAKREMQAVTGSPEASGGAHYYLGRIAKIDQDLETASGHLQKAVRLLPDFADAHAELGLVYTRQNDYGSASRELQRALDLDANNYLANTNLLILYSRTKDDRTAAQTVRVKQLQNEREKRLDLLMRTIEVRPY